MISKALECDDPDIEADIHDFGSDGQVTDEELATIAATASSFKRLDESTVYAPKQLEMLVRTNTRRLSVVVRRGVQDIENVQDGLTYSIGPASAPFLAHIQAKADMLGDKSDYLGDISQNSILGFRRFGNISQDGDSSERQSAVESWRSCTLLTTVKVQSRKDRSSTAWRQIADAFLFHVAYNLDTAFIPVQWNLETGVTSRLVRSPRKSLKDFDPPRRLYLADLVHHYQLGVSAESPPLQYLSFYHIAEHWFNSVFEDDLINRVQQTITEPSFSYRRKSDTRELIRMITNASKLRDEEVIAASEKVALELTLRKFVALDALTAELTRNSPSLVNHYRDTEVSFCQGDKFDLRDESGDQLYSQLASRIYKTRNALVHSKDGPRSRYIPFQHDGALRPEIQLIRTIAEAIVIATSEQPSG